MPSGRYLRKAFRVLAAAALLTAAAVVPPEALAVRPQSASRGDAKRFGLDQAARPARRGPSVKARAAFERFNRDGGGAWRMRFDGRTGLPAALVDGVSAPHPGTPQQAAAAFLRAQRGMLGIDPDALSVEKVSTGKGARHVLYRQAYKGLPVEFARVKVHLDDRGRVTGVHSRFEPDPGFDVVPSVAEAQAAEAVRRDCGAAPSGPGALVVFPDQASGQARLAWKLTARPAGALWRYYVDARTGAVLFRYNDMRFWAVCNSQGHVTGQVYDVDPASTPVLSARPFRNQNVYVVDASTFATTYKEPDLGDGFFCSTKLGAMFTQLQGPYVNVSNFRGRSLHHDNGGGLWFTVATPVSSPHPYPDSAFSTATVNVIDPFGRTVVKALPVFTAFQVGTVGSAGGLEGSSIIDDDELAILDPRGYPVAGFYGNRGAFHGTAVPGNQYQLRLRSNEAGQNYGYDVSLSSYLILPTPNNPGPSNELAWSTTTALEGMRSEISLFYHMNQMHDFFNNGIEVGGPYGAGYTPGVNSGGAADINSKPVNAIALMGPDITDPFYNPDQDNINFGDMSLATGLTPSDDLTDDATVIRHEYSHYVLEKVFSIQNFGQAGAISEGLTDYWAATSLNSSSIGLWYNRPNPPLRELDCHDPGKIWAYDKCSRLCNLPSCEPCGSGYCDASWQGEIHLDSIFFSQALWDVRRDQIGRLGSSLGQACSDGLMFQAYLFFPESFDEFLDALKRIDAAGAVAACGGAGLAQASIVTRFAAHGIPPGGGANELHTGFETALDVSTYTSVPGTISPAGHADFFTFAAGPGPVSVTITLPAHGSPSDGYYYGYGLTLYDYRHRLVAYAPDAFAYCDENDCTSASRTITLRYDNPSGGQLFLQVAGGFGSGVNSLLPYSLELEYPPGGALRGSLVQASLDRDLIDFSVVVTSWPKTQDYRFAYAQLRDQAHAVIPNTRTDAAGSFLIWLSSHNALGQIQGQVRLATAAYSGSAMGFSARFPSVGTVYLEVFGYNVVGSTVSLGLSNAINLSTDRSELKAFNNIFNPARGEKATVRYDVESPGHLTIRLYTLNGTLVTTLFDGDVPAGKGTVDWAGQNIAGSRVASGVYIVHMSGAGVSRSQKIVVVK